MVFCYQMHSTRPVFHVTIVQAILVIVWSIIGWQKSTLTNLGMPLPNLLAGSHPPTLIVDIPRIVAGRSSLFGLEAASALVKVPVGTRPKVMQGGRLVFFVGTPL